MISAGRRAQKNTLKCTGHSFRKLFYMDFDDNQQLQIKKKILIKAAAAAIKKLTVTSGKSENALCREYDIALGLLSKLKKGCYSDIKLSTIWKIANALDISPIIVFQMIIDELPQNFNFYD